MASPKAQPHTQLKEALAAALAALADPNAPPVSTTAPPTISRVPDDPNALLRRRRTAEALTAAGYPTAESTLATKGVRGGGPPYQLFGRTPLYRWRDALAWAESRMSAPRRSSSEADAQRAA